MVALSFKKWKAPLVESGKCVQTIRATWKNGKVPWKVGDLVQLYFGMRTQHCRKLVEFDPILTEVLPCKMGGDDEGVFTVFVEYSDRQPAYLTADELQDLATLDGFQSVRAMYDFFAQNHGFPFEGYILRWRHRKPFRPSNGTGGDIFVQQWCSRCTKGRDGDSGECKIYFDALVGEQPKEWYFFDDIFKPTCSAFRNKETVERKPRRWSKAPPKGQGNLFDWAVTKEGNSTLGLPLAPQFTILGTVENLDGTVTDAKDVAPVSPTPIPPDLPVTPTDTDDEPKAKTKRHLWVWDGDEAVCKHCGMIQYCGQYERGNWTGKTPGECTGRWKREWNPPVAQRLGIGPKHESRNTRGKKRQNHKWVDRGDREVCQFCNLVRANHRSRSTPTVYIGPDTRVIGGKVPPCTSVLPENWNPMDVDITTGVKEYIKDIVDTALAMSNEPSLEK